MKKLYSVLMFAVFVVGYGNLAAQSAYTGAIKPSGSFAPQQQFLNNNPPMNGIQICQSCAIAEGEPDIPNNGTDVTDGGCNFLPLHFKTINIGDVYCGRGNGYVVGTPPDTIQWRDTDWYRFILLSTTTIFWTGYANFPIEILVADTACSTGVFVYQVMTLSPGVPGSISVTLPAGAYYAFVAPVGFGTSPSNTGDYMVKLSTTDPGAPATWCPPVCIPTVSQWGLIILALLLLAAEMVYLRRRKYAFSLAGSTEVQEHRRTLIDRRSYFMAVAILLGIATLVFTVEAMLSVSIPLQDYVGAFISSVILAFIIQLFSIQKKE